MNDLFIYLPDGNYNIIGYYDYAAENLTWYNKEKWMGKYIHYFHYYSIGYGNIFDIIDSKNVTLHFTLH